MPLVHPRKFIRLSLSQRIAAGIEPGDLYESYVDRQGFINIIRHTEDVSGGVDKPSTVVVPAVIDPN